MPTRIATALPDDSEASRSRISTARVLARRAQASHLAACIVRRRAHIWAA